MRSAVIATLLGVSGASMAGGCATECDRLQGWRNTRAPACQACGGGQCGNAYGALFGAAVSAECRNDVGCLDACWRGDRNDIRNLNCGCAYGCLQTPSCRRAFDNWTNCLVTQCDPQCR